MNPVTSQTWVKKYVLVLPILFLNVSAEELAPDDPSISGSLSLWLRNADIDYDPAAGEWLDSSGNDHHAQGIGVVDGITWSAPNQSSIAGGTLTPNELESVHFSGDRDDILAITDVNDGSGLSELTIITVYSTSSNNGINRPLGFGSISAAGNLGNHFNLASDPSIRKDNGQIGSGGYSAAIPLNTPFIRSARMDSNGVDEWFNTTGNLNAVLTDAGTSFTTSSDEFFLGDVRAGASSVSGSTNTADADIVEVLVYNTALSDTQIADINEWLVANLGGTPAPSVTTFTGTPGMIPSGGSTTLDWVVERANTVNIAPTVGTVTTTGTMSVSPTTTTTYTLTATGAGGMTTAEVTIGVDVPVSDPIITEILASNDNGLEDEDADASDWIEIHNPNAFDLDLSDYYLSDEPTNPTQWKISSGTIISGGQHLLVFASGKDRAISGSELHTNFSLSSSGETLRLIAPDGFTVVSEVNFPAQITDISYGIDDTDITRFLTPTPGAPNSSGFDGRVSDTNFSLKRGFYETPQSLTITSDTIGAVIRYTTDGSEPTETNGTTFTTAIPITTTTVLRAAAFKAGLLATNVDTQSYLFLDDVIQQPANPVGAPTSWGSRSVDYEMDPDVVNDPAYRDEIIDGLKSIRTLSIVAPNDQFFDGPLAIYANPQNDGRAWEREVSFEFLHSDDSSEDVQTNCGIRIHGNGSRSANGQPKHGFRVEFRGEYGMKNLNYKLFPDTNVDEFDSIILRGQNAHGWTRNSQIGSGVGTTEREQSQYIRDSFARDIMKDMGQTSGESTYVHLYINGIYWGLYNPVEYPRAAYGVSHFGGEDEEYDAINRRTVTTKILDGTFDAWNEMQDLANSGLETQAKYEEMETHLDIDNHIDYFLMHQYMGSRDGPEVFDSNNMRAIRKTRGDNTTTWIGMPWDMEASMFEIDVTRNVNVGDASQQAGSLARVYSELRENPEFRLRYADRVRRHCFNGGALTPARVAATWEVRANELYTAIIGESARWGDFRRPALPYTRDAEWEQERNRLLNDYFPTRADFLVELLRDNDLYPETDAPDFNRTGDAVAITVPEGTIYFTTDGSDPREMWTSNAVGSNYAAPITLTQSSTVKARALNNGEWSALTESDFLVGTLASASNTVVSEIMYNPDGDDVEYIELANISNQSVDYSGVHFTAGIDFTVPTGTIIPAGGFLVITDFENETGLSNGGEMITLVAADAIVIESFRYDDNTPWPSSPDGNGTSLTRILPASDPTLATSWRSSIVSGGSPGSSDATSFTGNPNADVDGDGLSALLEYAIGSDDLISNTRVTSLAFNDGMLAFTLRRSLAAEDISWSLEQSTDLETWTPSGIEFENVDDQSEGTGSIIFQLPEPSDSRVFWRARVDLN